MPHTKCEGCGTNPIFPIIQPAGDTGFLEHRQVPALSKRCHLCRESASRINILARKFLDLCSASAADHDHEHFALRIDRLVTLCVLFVGLDLIFLLIVRMPPTRPKQWKPTRASRTRRLTWQSLILQWTRPFGGKRVNSPILWRACGLLEDTVPLAPRDAIPTTHSAIAYRSQHMGAVMIRDRETNTCANFERSKGWS